MTERAGPKPPPPKYTQAQLDARVKAVQEATIRAERQAATKTLTQEREQATAAVRDARKAGEDAGRAAETATRDHNLSRAALDVRRTLESWARDHPDRAKSPRELAVQLFAIYTAGMPPLRKILLALRSSR